MPWPELGVLSGPPQCAVIRSSESRYNPKRYFSTDCELPQAHDSQAALLAITALASSRRYNTLFHPNWMGTTLAAPSLKRTVCHATPYSRASPAIVAYSRENASISARANPQPLPRPPKDFSSSGVKNLDRTRISINNGFSPM